MRKQKGEVRVRGSSLGHKWQGGPQVEEKEDLSEMEPLGFSRNL